MTIFIRLIEQSVEDKPNSLREAISALADPSRTKEVQDRGALPVFEERPSAFAQVPGSPFAYWVTHRVRSTFGRFKRFDAAHVAVRGAYTTDDFKYFRLAWEVSTQERARTRAETWAGRGNVPLSKGGSFSPFYADVYLVIRWHNDGKEAKAFLAAYRDRKGWGTDWSACLNGYGSYFRAGLTWPRRTDGLSFRVMPAGGIFADKGPGIFVEGDSVERLLSLCAIMNSAAFRYLVGIQLARTELAQSYEVGLIQQTPIPDQSKVDVGALSKLARRAWSLKRWLDTTNEVSHAFALHVTNPGLLLDAWRETYDFSKHQILRGHVSSRTSEEGLRHLVGTFTTKKLRCAATGLGAAWFMTQFAGFRLMTVYVAEEPSEAALKAVGFRAEERGANAWLVVPTDAGVFDGAEDREGVLCVHPVQAYLDLKGQPERAEEAATELRKRLLNWKA